MFLKKTKQELNKENRRFVCGRVAGRSEVLHSGSGRVWPVLCV